MILCDVNKTFKKNIIWNLDSSQLTLNYKRFGQGYVNMVYLVKF